MTLRTLLRTAIAALLLSAAAHAHVTVSVVQSEGAGSGNATLSASFDDWDCAYPGVPTICGVSLTKLAPPGIPLPGGANLLILPDAVMTYTQNFWGTVPITTNSTGAGSGSPCIAQFAPMPLPPSAAGLIIHVQSVGLFGVPLQAVSTPVWSQIITP